MRYVALALVGPLLLAACSGGGAGNGGNAEPSATVQGGPPELPSGLEPTQTAEGLQIYEIAIGDGPTPTAGGVVQMEYDAWLEDGTRFDTTSSLAGPYESPFGTGILIDGLEEGLKDMHVGGERRFIIPPDLAYGEQGIPPTIPGNATLTFDVRLVGVKPPDTQQ